MHSKSPTFQDCEVFVRGSKYNPDIADDVHDEKEDVHEDEGDHRIMFTFASVSMAEASHAHDGHTLEYEFD